MDAGIISEALVVTLSASACVDSLRWGTAESEFLWRDSRTCGLGDAVRGSKWVFYREGGWMCILRQARILK